MPTFQKRGYKKLARSDLSLIWMNCLTGKLYGKVPITQKSFCNMLPTRINFRSLGLPFLIVNKLQTGWTLNLSLINKHRVQAKKIDRVLELGRVKQVHTHILAKKE